MIGMARKRSVYRYVHHQTAHLIPRSEHVIVHCGHGQSVHAGHTKEYAPNHRPAPGAPGGTLRSGKAATGL